MFPKRKRGAGEVSTEAADWAVLTGQNDGRPMFVRKRTSSARSLGKGSLGIQIGVAIPLPDAGEDGLPREADMAALDSIEEAIIAEAGDKAVLVAVITTSGMREFVLYTDTGDWIEAFHHRLMGRISSHDVHVMAQADPKWETFAAFA